MRLTKDEVCEELIRESKIFHYGTLSSTHAGVREATRYAVETATACKAIRSFDPNLREPLWDSLENARKEILYGLAHCDILKISDNEIEFLFGHRDYDAAAAALRENYNIKLICITLGREGSRAYYEGKTVFVPGFVQKNTIETTGAGDTFCACVLNYVLEHGLDQLTEKDLTQMLTFANAAASVITTRKGALRVMPDREEIETLIRQ